MASWRRLLRRRVDRGFAKALSRPRRPDKAAPDIPHPPEAIVNPRVKKLIGLVALVVGVSIYALIVMSVGQIRLANSSPLVQLAFFAFFGLIWVVPAGLLIRWMERKKPSS
jgi:hypothetical protein